MTNTLSATLYDDAQTLRVMATDETAENGEWLETDTWVSVKQ